ncbi:MULTISPECIES: DUF6777 domain-containing protein [Streptomyces]|uniref:DUF6777 domain-containing protein n=1 Tax=Streptomyces chartreusis NRRL 3882 TaxID=1079985 RepID=A0A2N9B260_STRCX|nr:DUF6777 domain-containing protein [Streptomyces chartreusis]MYS89011.1 hypothetical protein [Streptomyces sp. SID5464]SOR77428.1 hypothetical protein SCNRRL3882_0900 [Streptomyces chartreusis NRRL 3882]
MRTPTGTFVTACALFAALLLSGCGGDGDAAGADGALFLQPAAAQGPNPFTDSTATTTVTPSPTPRTPATVSPGGAARVSAGLSGLRSLSGGTPGLYGGTERTGSCDVARQIGHLTREPARTRAFARVAGVSPASVPDHLRGLTPVVLRADTRVTDHGFRAGRAVGRQAVLQAGTAVLVDDRGVPRVRCACGNPLRPPVTPSGTPHTEGTPWPGYRPGRVVVVTPAPQVITTFTIVDAATRRWIERRTGHDVRHDRALPPPVWATNPPAPTPAPSEPPAAVPREPLVPREPGGTSPESGVSPRLDSASSWDTSSPSDVSPPVTAMDPPPADGAGPLPDEASPEDFGGPDVDEVGPDAVPDGPDPPDGAGLIPDDRAADSILGSPTDVFGN